MASFKKFAYVFIISLLLFSCVWAHDVHANVYACLHICGDLCMHAHADVYTLCVHVCKGSRLKLGVFLDFSSSYLLNPELASTN